MAVLLRGAATAGNELFPGDIAQAANYDVCSLDISALRFSARLTLVVTIFYRTGRHVKTCG